MFIKSAPVPGGGPTEVVRMKGNDDGGREVITKRQIRERAARFLSPEVAEAARLHFYQLTGFINGSYHPAGCSSKSSRDA